MSSIRRALSTDLLRLRLFERELRIRVLHGVLLGILVAVALILVFAVGVFVGFEYPYKTRPAPKVPPGFVKPNPSTCKHVMGGCLPHPKSVNSASITATNQGPDLSNNNPVSCSQIAEIARHNSYLFLKVNESGFVDSTARGMASCARSHGLIVGGYDFLHVCLSDPVAEARVYASAAKNDGIVGKRTLPPTGDSEWPSSPQCNVRNWIQTWANTVHALLNRWAQIYTGAWWWNPHVGAWLLAHALRWVSGYTSWVSLPIPAGFGGVDFWQFTDHGWNGATTSDLSLWRDGAAAFKRAALISVRRLDPFRFFPKVKRKLRFGVRASEYYTVKSWYAHKCHNPARRPTCKATRYHVRLLRDRVYFVATHHLVRGHWKALKTPRWTFEHLGARFKGMSKILTMR